MSLPEKQIILDNRTSQTSVGGYLCKQLAGGAKTLRIVSAYFTVYAYQMLHHQLKQVGAVQFLYGDPSSVGEVDPGEKETKDFGLTERGLVPQTVLKQKYLAIDCEKWIIENKVEIRTIKQANLLHGKMYHIKQNDDLEVAVLGSSNFTYRGLGFNRGANLELNLAVSETDTCDQLKHWFDGVWRDKTLTRDAKEDVLAALRRLGENYSPEFVYFKTLLEVFRDRLDAREEVGDRLGDADLKDTQIWKKLYQFQRDGVAGIINRLRQHNGCILADSVGLGKTYTALAVIRYYQTQNQRVLVLCPKKLTENWKLYTTQFGQIGNPFKDDNFHYEVLHHSDLSRVSGESNGINLATFDWSVYGLVVIDESHNFRKASRSTRDESGKIIHRSRYERLLEEIIQAGGKTSVLMLSATPVNTSLDDLRNQICFMTGENKSAFKETLGISNFHTMLSAAQKQFKHWEQQVGEKHKRDLFDKLGGELFTLLDAVSIARSRRHIKKFYPEVVKEIGGFPKQAKPKNETPPTDLQGDFSFEVLNKEIKTFRLSIYTPSKYVISEQVKRKLAEEKKKFNFDQTDREISLIGMIRVNFLKRLESAAPSMALTLERTIKKIEQMMERIERCETARTVDAEVSDYDWEYESEDEDFIVSKADHSFNFKDLDLSRWLVDLEYDSGVLKSVLKKVAAITPQRDGKLAALKQQICDKLTNPTTDKDGRKNRKVLIFTTFKDTALYLYKELTPLMDELRAKYAMVAGDETKTNYGNNKFNDILTNFAPIGRNRPTHDENGALIADGESIDILIATDCVSEGQNLQDCDMVVNYDIHWNPVRLIQRFGRIDRIGSRNQEVKMVNFWPMAELDLYINLQGRVESRMALVTASATGDDHLAQGTEISDDTPREEHFRDTQLRHMRDGVLDLDELDDGVTLSDFSLDDFLAQLMNYLEQNRQQLENAPLGVYAVSDCARQQESLITNAAPGVIFCLRHKNPPNDAQARSSLKNYYLVYVRDDGEVRYNYTHAKQVLELFGELARGQTNPLCHLCDAFDRETNYGKDMEKYDQLLKSVFSAISKQFDRQEAGILNKRDGVLSKQSEQPRGANDFELVTWLVIKETVKKDD